jgi:hypothetical protein
MLNKVLGIAAAVIFALTLIPAVAMAGDESEADKPAIKVRFLLQGQAQMTENGNPGGDGWGNEMFLRRARIILAGKVNRWIHFFMETDNPNMGKNGNWGVKTYVQDAFVDFQMFPEFKVAVGMILLPFTHMNRQGATSLNSLDYHNPFSKGFVAGNAWRDAGIEARGIVANTLDYRIGVFNGLRGKADSDLAADEIRLNSDDSPRVTGRVAVNVFEPEKGFFYGGTSLGKSRILSAGLGFDFQPGAALDDQGGEKMYMALSGDVFWDIPLNDEMEITGQVAFVMFDRGNDQGMDENKLFVTDTFTPNAGTGMGAYGDIGFRYGMWQPVIGGEWFDSDKVGADLMNMRGGVNMWIKGHAANLKLEYALTQTGDHDGTMNSGSQITLQSQFLF